jgi:hypothetical protein
MRMRLGWWMAMLALAPAPAAAQTPATAEETARAFLAALDGRRWDAAAELISPAAVRRQRDLTLAMALAGLQARQKNPRGGNLVVSSSGTVDSAQLRRFGSHRVRTLRGVSTLAEAAALEPRVFLARMMESATVGAPGMVMTPRAHRYLGVLVENDSVAHALFREEGRVERVDQEAQVLELRRIAGRWHVLPGTALMVRASLLLDFPGDP